MSIRKLLSAFLIVSGLSVAGCTKSINADILGTNAFVNDAQFGTIPQQFGEVQQTLGLNFVRVLMVWSDGVQPTPTSPQDFGYYDSIIAGIPAGMDAIIVMDGLPSWMSTSSNWQSGNPRLTFVNQWVGAVSKRYANSPAVLGFEVWNEPNMTANPDNTTLAVATSPANYVQMLQYAYPLIHATAPGKQVVSAATTAIAQSWPNAFKYNKDMVAAGAEQYLDIYGVHYYGTDKLHVLEPAGIGSFLNKITKPVWLTESGQKGYDKQLQYAEEMWPFLIKQIPTIKRIYQYQFTEDTPASSTFGLRNLTAGEEYSNLYNYLKKNK